MGLVAVFEETPEARVYGVPGSHRSRSTSFVSIARALRVDETGEYRRQCQAVTRFVRRFGHWKGKVGNVQRPSRWEMPSSLSVVIGHRPSVVIYRSKRTSDSQLSRRQGRPSPSMPRPPVRTILGARHWQGRSSFAPSTFYNAVRSRAVVSEHLDDRAPRRSATPQAPRRSEPRRPRTYRSRTRSA